MASSSTWLLLLLLHFARLSAITLAKTTILRLYSCCKNRVVHGFVLRTSIIIFFLHLKNPTLRTALINGRSHIHGKTHESMLVLE